MSPPAPQADTAAHSYIRPRPSASEETPGCRATFPPITVQKQQNSLYAKVQPHRLSISGLLLKGTTCTGPGHSDSAVPFPHRPLCSPLICVLCGLFSKGRDFTGTRETGVTTFKAPASSSTLATVIYNGRHPISMSPAHSWL